MRAPELLTTLNRIEAEVPVQTWRLMGLQIWPLARGQISWRAQQSAVQHRPASPNLNRVRAGFRQLLPSGPIHRSGPKDLVLLTNGASAAMLGGRPYDRHCGPISEAAAARQLSTLLLDPGPGVAGGADARLPVGPLLIAAKGVAAWAGRYGRVDPLPGWPVVQRILADSGHRDLLRLAVLRRHAAEVRIVSASFRRLLERTRPRAVFVVGFDITSFAMCVACKSLNIPTIEVQHGLQGALHWSYAGWGNVPADGWTMLPNWFWVWTDEDAAGITAWAGLDGPHRPLVGGNVWLRRWLDDHEEDVPARSPSPGRPLHILVTLQTGFSRHPGLDELIRVANRLGACVTFRIHPTMGREERLWVQAVSSTAAGRVELPDTHPLYTSLVRADVHVTVSSASVTEAAVLGRGSVVLDPLGPVLFQREHQLGIAVTWRPEEPMAPLLHRMAGVVASVPAPPPVTAGLDALGL